MSIENTETTSDISTPETLPNAAQVAAVGTKPGIEGTPQQPPQAKPDNLGSQFAALDRRQRALRQQEQELASKRSAHEASLKEIQELDNLSADELLERIAKRKGRDTDSVIRDYIAKKTGAPTAEQALKDSKDPAIAELARKTAELERNNAELKKQLEEKDLNEKQSREAQQARASVEFVQNECLQSSKAIWAEGDETSDYALFFADQKELATRVFQHCATVVSDYHKKYGFPPEESEVQTLIKDAPAILLKAELETSRGKRLAALKASNGTSQSGAAKPSLRPHTPRVPKGDETPDTKQPVRTRFSNQERVQKYLDSLPDEVSLAGL
jgi:ribosomal protein S24E